MNKYSCIGNVLIIDCWVMGVQCIAVFCMVLQCVLNGCSLSKMYTFSGSAPMVFDEGFIRVSGVFFLLLIT